MLRSQNVRPLRFDISNCEYIPAEFDQELEKSRLHGNEILVVRSGVNVGDCCVYPAVEGKANCSDLVITRPLKGLNPSYAAMYVVSPIGKAALRLQRVGNAQPHFNVRSMKKSLFPLAPYDEQARIVGIVEQAINKMDEVIKSLEAESQLKQLDQSILAKAFRGELVPQDPNDEPASQLLERIQSERANDANAKPTRGRNKRSSVKAND